MAAAQTWTIRAMLGWCEGYLGRHGDGSPRRSAEVLVGKACGLERIGLYLDMDRPLSPDELDVLRDDVRRRGQGMPLQYITGTAPFRYLELKVAPGVLIPRPETEVLVSEALALLPAAPKPQDSYDLKLLEALAADARAQVPAGSHGAMGPESPEPARASGEAPGAGEGAPDAPAFLVADICTGSGCIACSMATEHPLVRVVATDIADEAVELAADNAAACGVADRVQVLQGDLGLAVPAELMGAFDLVLSNPPYVPTGVLRDIPREVADFEPALALDGGADGLDVFRRLAPWALEALKPDGHLACELHETCLDAAAGIARDAGFSETRIVADLAGRPRVLLAAR